MERFYVATTTGYLEPFTDGNAGRIRPGVTAMVLDRLNMHRPVVQLRSEDVRPPSWQTRQAFVVKRAEEECVALNAGGALPDLSHTGRRHGTAVRYRAGKCRCDLCRAANAAEQRAYKARRKQF